MLVIQSLNFQTIFRNFVGQPIYRCCRILAIESKWTILVEITQLIKNEIFPRVFLVFAFSGKSFMIWFYNTFQTLQRDLKKKKKKKKLPQLLFCWEIGNQIKEVMFHMFYKIIFIIFTLALQKLMKNAFYFILKALFVLKVFKFLS